MKTFKVSTSNGAYFVSNVSCGWVACQAAQQELGEDVEVYTAIEVDEEEAYEHMAKEQNNENICFYSNDILPHCR